MDPFTHATVGASAALLRCKTSAHARAAAFAGMVGGILPDSDIFIRAADNPMLQLMYHRHFTHSLVFIPLGGLVAALLCWPFLRKKLSFGLLYLFATLGYALHGVLDAATNYGTHLLWPFTNVRESWSVISVVDPLFTLPLMGLLLYTLITRKPRMMRYSLGFAALYLALGVVQRERAETALLALADERKHQLSRVEIKPGLATNMVWRLQYEADGNYYIDAAHINWWGGVRYYSGGVIPKPDSAALLASLPENSPQRKDLEQFAFFSDGWIMQMPENPDMVGDARFSMRPDGIKPLWAITLKPQQPEEHVGFVSMRERTQADIAQYWRMMRGLPLDNTAQNFDAIPAR